MLSERLKELEQEAIVERRVFPEPPIHVEYSLTPKGKALGPILDEIETWSHDWIALDPELLDAGSQECDLAADDH